MPYYIIDGDITTMPTDAIVNAANSNLMHGGGVARSIAVAAGEEEMAAASAEVAPCPVGGAVYTPGFALPAKYVIHAVGPVWEGGDRGEEELLGSAYRSSLELARDLGCASVSFPLISSGIFGYPRDEAFRIAGETIEGFLEGNEMEVYLVLYNGRKQEPSRRLDLELDAFIRDLTAPAVPESAWSEEGVSDDSASSGHLDVSSRPSAKRRRAPRFGSSRSGAPLFIPDSQDALTNMLENLDASFSDAVFALIDAKGLTDPQVYNKVHMSRQSFSKLRQPGYHPKKTTAIVLALALELDLDQTQELLGRAGYTLSTSFPQDCVTMFFINKGVYDVGTINRFLFERDLPLLSS